MRYLRVMFVLMALMISAGAFAQIPGDGDPFGSPGGTSSGGGDGCWLCQSYGNTAYGQPYYQCNPQTFSWWTAITFPGDIRAAYSSCHASNPDGGPGYCQYSGYCLYTISDHANGVGEHLSAEQQIEGITRFISNTKKPDGAPWFDLTAFNDFIAATDHALRGLPYAVAAQKRLDAYRAEFATLNGCRELEPGAIPVLPGRSAKAPSTTIAAK